jgi:hypothetical protein
MKMSQISINILHGNSSVGDDDRLRAEAAALASLAAAGITAAAAYAEFQRQWTALGTDEAADAGLCQDYDSLTGLAASWVDAERAADRALTLGWARPDGAACTIAA